jgi:hypothetical protein
LLAEDLDGNRMHIYVNFSINAPTILIYVDEPSNPWFEKPLFGISRNSTYDLILKLEQEDEPIGGTCRYQYNVGGSGNDSLSDWYDIMPFDFNENNFVPNSTQWTVLDVSGRGDGNLAQLAVICLDVQQNYTLEFIEVGFDNTAPSISPSFTVNPITSPTNKLTNLEVSTDDDSFCVFENVLYNNQYGDMGESYRYYFDLFEITDRQDFTSFQAENLSFHELIVPGTPDYPGPFYYVFDINCTNLADISAVVNATLMIEIDENLTITPLIPPYVNRASFELSIMTNHEADCELKEGSETSYYEFDESDGLIHNHSLSGLDNGATYNYDVRCQSATGYRESTVTFTIDLVSPGSPTITADTYTCGLDNIEASFSASDNEGGSGVDGFLVTITGPRDFNVERYVSSSITEPVPNMEEGDTYTVSARAVDMAGNIGGASSKSITASLPGIDACDHEPPFLIFEVIEVSNSRKDLNVTCEDDGSGCKDYFLYSTSAVAENCEPSSSRDYGDLLTFTETKKFCYFAEDNNYNNDSGSMTIVVGYDEHCFDGILSGDESDVDCGGSCPGCEIGDSCEDYDDCSSNYCLAGVCTEATCSDGAENGDESDVDCGGSCSACAEGKKCDSNYDCSSGYCNEQDVCEQATCDDGFVNQGESDIDCGGYNCDPCEAFKTCLSSSDCASGVCEDGRCGIDRSLDTDGDGMPDFWEHKYFGCTTCADPEVDYDDDRFTNLEEYLSNTDPTDPNSKPPRKTPLIAVILLILGILLVLGGAGYLVYNRFYGQKPEDITVQTPVSGGERLLRVKN